MEVAMARVTLLAIGTELTQGQITNRNAAWISKKLTDLGFDVRLHMTVADDRPAMIESFEVATSRSELLIITGGLGPTTDDFTREALSEWSGYPLEFRPESWKKIVDRLTERGIVVAEANKQQCYFPKSSHVFENLEGTADAFGFQKKSCTVIALPGPPRELEHLWDRFIHAFLVSKFPNQIPERLETWKCLGISESALGELVEKTVQGSGLKTGYRASVPYVEVKIWVPSRIDLETANAAIEKLDEALKSYSVARGAEDLCTNFLRHLDAKTGTLGITVLDLGTQGILSERIIQALKDPKYQSLQTRFEIMTRYSPASSSAELPEMASEWLFALFPNGESAVLCPEGKHIEHLPSPYSSPLMNDRLRRYRTEMAMKHWSQVLLRLAGGAA